MTLLEIVRLTCYTILAPVLLYLALALARRRMYAHACFYLAVSLLFTWFLFEVTLLAAGVNTRNFRSVATPFVLMATISGIWSAINLAQWRWVERWRTRRNDGSVIRKAG